MSRGKMLWIVAGWLLAVTCAAHAQSVFEIKTGSAVERIDTTPSGVLIRTRNGFLTLAPCGAAPGVCAVPAPAPSRLPAPENGLPDGGIARVSTGDIRAAWYARPTDRYAHGALGDAIEAGSLVVEREDGTVSEFVLPENQVFEDIAPRIADINGDGRNEVIAIRASQTGGAAAVIYGLTNGRLGEIAAGSENGRANRWLNIAGFVPRIDGGLTVLGVRTPHIGGRLFSLDLHGNTVTEENDLAGDVSNHVIGSRELGLSAIGPFGGRTELVLPSQDRKRLRFPLSNRADIALPRAIDRAIAIVDGRIVTATERGELLVVSP